MTLAKSSVSRRRISSKQIRKSAQIDSKGFALHILNSERFVTQLLCALGAVHMVRVNEVEDGEDGDTEDQDLAQALAQRGLAQTIL